MAENPSGSWPDFKVQWDAAPFLQHVTEIVAAPTGREQRRARLQTAGLRRWTFSSDALSATDRQTLRNFFNTQRGRFGAFYFFNPFPETLTAFPLGTVAGTTLIVPMKGLWFAGQTPITATYANVKVATVLTPTSAITANIGAHGEDRFTWAAGQAGAVTADVTLGRECVIARFDMDELGASLIRSAVAIAAFRIAIKELVP